MDDVIGAYVTKGARLKLFPVWSRDKKTEKLYRVIFTSARG